jgi:putative ABC transport system permease protein
VALFLFCTLQAVLETINTQFEVGSEKRMVVRNSISIIFDLPMSYLNWLKTLPEVASVSYSNWFGGIYIDERNFFPQFAVEAETYLAMYPELVVPEDQKQVFFREQTACIVGAGLIKKYGWKIGDTFHLSGTIYPGDWPFTIRGVYTASNKAIGDLNMYFHWKYLYEKSGREAMVGSYILELKDPGTAGDLAKKIDAHYENSSRATLTQTEKAFVLSFVSLYGNIGFLINSIGMAITFAILLVTSNTMIMSVRERFSEIAVMKTLGFTDMLIFRLILIEAVFLCLLGGVFGCLFARFIYQVTGFDAGGFLPGFSVSNRTITMGLIITVLVGLVSGLLPAWQSSGLSIVKGLRKVQ